MRLEPLVVAFSSALLAAACTVGPDYRRPELDLTASYARGGALAAGSSREAWWQSFKDPVMDKAIERALSQNLELAEVSARLQQARAAARYFEADLLPVADVEAAGESVRASVLSPQGAIANAVGADRSYHDYSIAAQASWEIDLFGGRRRKREAAEADERAAEAGAGSVRLSVAAEVADAYIALRGLQARFGVAEHQERSQEKLVELVRLRFEEGVSSDRELRRATSALEGVRASTPPLRAAIEGQLNRLDVLMGRQPGTYRAEFLAAAAVPTAPAPFGSLAPADLLRRRPDVVAAEQRVVAANARIGAAIAEYYPRVSISGLFGFASLGGHSLISEAAKETRGFAGLRWRLLDFGRVDAEVAVARGREAEVLAAYRNAVLRAAEDVETALARYAHKGVEARALERQIGALRIAREQTWAAYGNGVVGLIDVLDADRELLAAEDKLAAARTDEARASVAVFRALGGGWNG